MFLHRHKSIINATWLGNGYGWLVVVVVVVVVVVGWYVNDTPICAGQDDDPSLSPH